MSIYLIDYENVHEGGLSGVKDLPEGDRVIVFYGDKIKSISFDVHVQMMNSKAVVEFIETHKTAKNYLDFQLGTYLGFLIGAGSHDSIVIVSHDTGFDSVVDFWKDRGYEICRREIISEIPEAEAQAAPAKEAARKSQKGQGQKGGSQKSQGQKNQGQKNQGQKGQAEKKERSRKNTEAEEKAAPEEAKDSVKENLPDPAQTPAGTEQTPEKQAGKKQKKQKQPEKKPSEKKQQGKKQPAEKDQTAEANGQAQPEASGQRSAEQNSAETEPTTQDPSAQKQEDLPADSQASKKQDAQKENRGGNQKKPDLPESFRKKVRAALRGDKLSSGNYTTIYRAISGSRDKLSLNNTLVKAYGSEKGGEVYNRVRDIFADYQTSAAGKN